MNGQISSKWEANILFIKEKFTDGDGRALGIFFSKAAAIRFVKENYPSYKKTKMLGFGKDDLIFEDKNQADFIYMETDYKISVYE